MPKMKFYDDATSQWIELDAKDADTVGGKSYAAIQSEIDTRTANKVDKVSGKGLSTNDYTTAEKNKLAGIAAGANNYTHPATHPVSMITGLHNVATSGSYNDLTNKPTIPTNTVSKSGDTMTGILTAQNNTSYTTGQTRNIRLYQKGATIPTLPNGTIAFVYE